MLTARDRALNGRLIPLKRTAQHGLDSLTGDTLVHIQIDRHTPLRDDNPHVRAVR